MNSLASITCCAVVAIAPAITAICIAQETADPQSATILAEGKAIVSAKCKQCHGIAMTDVSQHDDAPPFRDIANRYSVWLLAEALAEGILTGHPDMPEFVFDPDEINAILTYMESLKTKPGH